jgi:hypothetical protein
VSITNSGGSITISATGTGGTVTSVGVSGGATGFSFSNSPVTGAETMTMSGTLGVGYGGTGLTSVGTSGNVLTSDGTNWVSSPPSASGVTLAIARQVASLRL